MESLNVYLHGVRVGRLTEENGRMSFAYLPEYERTRSAEPLSYVPDVENRSGAEV